MSASLRRPLIVLILAVLLLTALTSIVVLAPATAHALDLPVHHWFVAHRLPALTTAAVALTRTGTSAVVIPVVIVVGLATGVGGVWQRLGHTALMFAVVLSGVLCRTGLSMLVGRARPPMADWATSASGLSFPSGHSADGVLVAGLVGWAILRRVRRPVTLRVAVALVLAAYAIGLGLTRAYLGVHWPLDVVGGWTFGVVWLALAATLAAAYRARSGSAAASAASSRPTSEDAAAD